MCFHGRRHFFFFSPTRSDLVVFRFIHNILFFEIDDDRAAVDLKYCLRLANQGDWDIDEQRRELVRDRFKENDLVHLGILDTVL